MNLLATIVSVFLVATLTANAAVFETYDKLVERYGKPVKELEFKKPVTKAYEFHKDKFRIAARFLGDVVGHERFSLVEGGELKKQEIGRILAANAANFKWSFDKNINRWVRSDNNAFAREDEDHTAVYVWTTQWKAAHKIEKSL